MAEQYFVMKDATRCFSSPRLYLRFRILESAEITSSSTFTSFTLVHQSIQLYLLIFQVSTNTI